MFIPIKLRSEKMSSENNIMSLVNDIRVNNAIVVIGAGVSFEPGMPLGNQLSPIVWEVVRSFPSIDEKFKGRGSTKNRIGEDPEKIKKAFSYIERNEEALNQFKNSFRRVNDKIVTPPQIHKNIAKLVHDNFFELIISFNWDSLLEMSWSELYGTQINQNKRNLIKPHGDVLKLNNPWVLPNSPGSISDEEKKYVNSLSKERPRTLVIVGYSESDAKIVEELILPFENKWKVYRVSPFSSDEGFINLSATDFFGQLVDNLIEDKVYKRWEFLNFRNQNTSLGRAILGYKLTPLDVKVCPEMPQVQKAIKILDLNHFVLIQGKPGSGKSISSYQVAYHYLNKGYEVLRFKTNDFIEGESFSLPYNPKAIYIIDDGHLLPTSILNNLQEKSGVHQKIIVTATDDIEVNSATVSISNNENIVSIREFYKENEAVVSSIISKIDKDLGDYFMQESFLERLDSASREDNLWTFNYVLRGGWKSTEESFYKLKDIENSQRLIFLLSLKQILTKDDVVDDSWLDKKMKDYFSKNAEWIDKTLKALRKKRLIDENKLRMVHYEDARRQLKFVFEKDKANRKEYEQIIYEEILSNSNSLLGKVWFMNTVFTSEIHSRIPYIISNNEMYNIIEENWSSTDKTIIAHTLYFMNSLTKFRKPEYFNLYYFSSLIQKEIENVDSTTAYSLATVINELYNKDSKKAKILGSKLDISEISLRVSSMKKEDLFQWSYFISRLGLLLSIEKAKEFFGLLNKEKIESELLLLENTLEDFEILTDFIFNIFLYDREYAIKLFYLMSDKFKIAFKKHTINSWHALAFGFTDVVMGFDSLRDKREYIKQDQKGVGEKIISFIEPEQLAEEIITVPFRSWHNLSHLYHIFEKYDSSKYSKFISHIDLKRLQNKFDKQDVWNNFHSEVNEFLFLYFGKRHVRIIDDFIFSNKDKLVEKNFFQFAFSPSLVKYYLENELYIPTYRGICSKNRLEWQALQILIFHLANQDIDTLRKFLLVKGSEIASAITNFEKIDLKSINVILQDISNFDQEVFQNILLKIDYDTLYNSTMHAYNPNFRSKEYLKGTKQKINLLYQQLGINNPLD